MAQSSFSADDVSPWFWNIVARAGRDRNRLRELLEQMSADDVVRFHDEFEEAAIELTDSPFIHHVDDDVSEDGMRDIAEWVVSQGKDFYSDVLRNPQKIPKDVDASANDTFTGLAETVFYQRFGRSPRG